MKNTLKPINLLKLLQSFREIQRNLIIPYAEQVSIATFRPGLIRGETSNQVSTKEKCTYCGKNGVILALFAGNSKQRWEVEQPVCHLNLTKKKKANSSNRLGTSFNTIIEEAARKIICGERIKVWKPAETLPTNVDN